jgi:hypothetical protein
VIFALLVEEELELGEQTHAVDDDLHSINR